MQLYMRTHLEPKSLSNLHWMTTGNSCLQMAMKKYVTLKTAWTLEPAIRHQTYWQNLHVNALRLKWIHVYTLLILAIMILWKPLQMKLFGKVNRVAKWIITNCSQGIFEKLRNHWYCKFNFTYALLPSNGM